MYICIYVYMYICIYVYMYICTSHIRHMGRTRSSCDAVRMHANSIYVCTCVYKHADADATHAL